MTPFVGRERELAIGQRAIEHLTAGRGGCVVIGGEPGIGKTRLARELSALADQRGVNVLRGETTSADRVPFGLFLTALGSASKCLTPGLAQHGLVQDADRSAASITARYRMHDAIRRVIEQAAIRRPVMLVLDDVQAADGASTEVVCHLLARPFSGPVLMVLTYRAGEVSPALGNALATATRTETSETLELLPFSEAEAEVLVGGRVGARTRAALYRESAGNPFYLTELARGLESLSPGDPPLIDAHVPAAIGAALRREVTRLTPPAKALVSAAAVVGDPVELELAARVAELAERDVLPALDELVRCQLLKPGRGSRGFASRCPAIRRALYESLDEQWRAAAHARAAAALASQGAPPTLLAPHVEPIATCGDRRAIRVLLEAAHASAKRNPRAAAHWFAAALRLLPAEARDERVALLTSLAHVLAISGRIGESRAVFDEAMSQASSHDDVARARLSVISARLHRTTADRALAAQQLVISLGQNTEASLASELRLELAIERWLAGEWSAMAQVSRDALVASESCDEPMLAAYAVTLLALAEKECGDLTASLANLARAQAIVDQLSDEQLAHRVEAVAYLGHVEYCVGRHREATGHLDRGLSVIHSTGQELFFVPLVAELGLVHTLRGRLDQARTSCEEAMHAAAALADPSSQTMAQILRAVERLACGDAVETLAATSAALATSAVAHEGYLHCLAGQALVLTRAFAQARARILDGAGGPDLGAVGADIRPQAYAVLAAADLGLGRPEEAERWVVQAEVHASELGLPVRIADAQRARAGLALRRGHPGLAALAAREAADAYYVADQPLDGATADLVGGYALTVGGDVRGATDLLERSHATFVGCGAARRAEVAARALAGLGRPVADNAARQREDEPNVELSAREVQVARLVCTGMTNRDVADTLFLSVKTVESHLARTYRKLGISTRAALPRALDAASID